jgi:hypothetical protein
MITLRKIVLDGTSIGSRLGLHRVDIIFNLILSVSWELVLNKMSLCFRAILSWIAFTVYVRNIRFHCMPVAPYAQPKDPTHNYITLKTSLTFLIQKFQLHKKKIIQKMIKYYNIK